MLTAIISQSGQKESVKSPGDREHSIAEWGSGCYSRQTRCLGKDCRDKEGRYLGAGHKTWGLAQLEIGLC